ncbi:MAG TPA: sulfocyanin-like copper-binding protein [Gaiellaceae bacterium]|nr:sulfocyanin-like copper-binding protein [Gaiellaceae bacterium]
MIAETVVALSLATKAPPSPHKFLAVDAHRHRVTITLIASYDGTNGGFNFDGYSRLLMWTVPRGWTVRVVCDDRGPLRHSCAVVRGADTATPAFRGAATPRPGYGLRSGQTARFTFRAAKRGVYRFASVVPGDEVGRLWDVLKITHGGKPTVVDLQAN